jgi:hypothetical protein
VAALDVRNGTRFLIVNGLLNRPGVEAAGLRCVTGLDQWTSNADHPFKPFSRLSALSVLVLP